MVKNILLACVLTAAGGYLLGSILFGVLISKVMYNDDVRNHGSGNAGMTNVLRTYGKLPAVFTTLGDVGKSVAAVNLGRFIFGALLSGTGAAWQNPLDPVCGAYLAAIFCMIGHSRPIFFGFKGGKGVLVGAGVTAIIQSSSASVGILQALSTTGAITYSAAIPIILGQNIGTCITAFLSSVGGSKNARRTAMVHFYFNLIGSILFLIGIYAIQYTVGFSFWDNAIDKGGIANFHTLFNLTCTVLFLPFTGLLVKLARSMPARSPLKKNGKTCDMRKLMAVMGLGIKQGETITVTVEGEDETVASEEIAAFLNENV